MLYTNNFLYLVEGLSKVSSLFNFPYITIVQKIIQNFHAKCSRRVVRSQIFIHFSTFSVIYYCYRADNGESVSDKVLAEGIGPQLATAYFNLKMKQVGALTREIFRTHSLSFHFNLKMNHVGALTREVSRIPSLPFHCNLKMHQTDSPSQDLGVLASRLHSHTRITLMDIHISESSASHCNTLRHTATHCSKTAQILESTRVHWSGLAYERRCKGCCRVRTHMVTDGAHMDADGSGGL